MINQVSPPDKRVAAAGRFSGAFDCNDSVLSSQNNDYNANLSRNSSTIAFR